MTSYIEASSFSIREIHPTSYLSLPVYLQNPPNLPSFSSPKTLICDFGSSLTKAGIFECGVEPLLICPSETLRLRRQNMEISLSGNRLFSDSARSSAKKVFVDPMSVLPSPFEDFCDYVFDQLKGARNDKVVFTETLGISPRFRATALELFFECYEFGSVLPCVDSLAMSYPDRENQSGVVVSIGAQKTQILPFIEGKIIPDKVKRLAVGVDTMKDTFVRLAQVKYDGFAGVLGPKGLASLWENETTVALDYRHQMRMLQKVQYESEKWTVLDPTRLPLFAINEEFPPHLLTTPLNPSTPTNRLIDDFFLSLDSDELAGLRTPLVVTHHRSEAELAMLAAAAAAAAERRAEASRRLRESLRERREASARAAEAELAWMDRVAELLASPEGKPMGRRMLEEKGVEEEGFKTSHWRLRIKLGKVSPAEAQAERYSLLHRPDEELSQRELRVKRCQKMQFERARLKAAARAQREANPSSEPISSNTNDSLSRASTLRARRRALRAKLRRLRWLKEETRLPRAAPNEAAEFEAAAKELLDLSSDAEPERYEQELETLHETLRTVEPSFDPDVDDEDTFIARGFAGARGGVQVSPDLFRSTEILFRPTLIGSSQKGLSESLRDLLLVVPPIVASRIRVVGGGSGLRGLASRLERDLKRDLGYIKGMDVNVEQMADPVSYGYKGIHRFLSDFEGKESGDKFFISRKEYNEYGPEILKYCPIGNF